MLVLPRYNPLLLAKRLATIDQLSEGRLIVGVGVGPDHERFRGFGLPSEARGRRLEESLDVMKALWGQTTVDHRGEFWTLADAAMGPKPRQRPHPPIWFGGSHPSALRRAAQLGDGWMGMGASSPEEFAQESMLIRDALKRLGKDPGDFTVSKRVYIAVTKEPDRARRRTSRFIAGVYGDEAPPDVVDRCCLIGDAEACVEGIDRLVAAGAEHLVLNPVFDPLGQLAALAEVVAMSRAA